MHLGIKAHLGHVDDATHANVQMNTMIRALTTRRTYTHKHTLSIGANGLIATAI